MSSSNEFFPQFEVLQDQFLGFWKGRDQVRAVREKVDPSLIPNAVTPGIDRGLVVAREDALVDMRFARLNIWRK